MKEFLNYVDFKTREYHKIYIDYKIVLFMLDYTNYKGPNNPYFNKTTRKRKGEKPEYDTFIVNRNNKNIYKRFLSGFGDRLKRFKCKPNDIVELDKTKVCQNEDIKFSIPIGFKRKSKDA